MNKLKKKFSNFSSESESISDEDNESFEDEAPELPVISQEGHYWVGKDYANTFKEDFRDSFIFSQGIIRVYSCIALFLVV